MFARVRRMAAILVVVASLFWGFSAANVQSANTATLPIGHAGALDATDVVYSQPPSSVGRLFASSLRDPNGSASDEWVWDDFTLGSTQAITEVQWRGGYDPAKLGVGGPVVDFTLAIYPTNSTGFEPDVAHPPLVHYQVGNNAGETPADVLGGVQTYDYHYSLPVPFQAAGGTKYWVQIEALQGGGAPDWGLSLGLGGDNHHFRKCCNEGLYQTITGDTAFTLLGPMMPINNLSATNNSPTLLGNATSLTATIAAGGNVSYQWNFGDGVSGQGQVVTHTYAAVGFYTALVTATNSASVVTASTPITIFSALPLANAGLNQTVTTGAEVMLDGSGSFALPGHLPLTYFWQQLGGTQVVLNSYTISRPTFIAPATPTTLTFTLVVTDVVNLASEPDQVQIEVVPKHYIYLPLIMR